MIIVDYHSGELLSNCLKAVYAQSYPPRRIIVVDNGGALQETGLAFGWPPVELLSPGYNSGFAKGNNLALKHVGDCDLVALLNPDALPERTWLERLVNAAERYEDCAAFGSRMYTDVARKQLDGTGDLMHVSGLVWRRDHGRTATCVRLASDDVFSPCAAAALYRRDVVVRLGGFDEDFFCYTEDVDLGFRIRLAGYRCRYVPGAEVVHRGSALTGFRSDFSLYYGHRNLLWLYVKNMPLPLLLLFLPLHAAMHVIAILRFALIGRGRILIKAKRDALNGFLPNWRKRHAIQPSRRATTVQILRAMSLW